jgi:hypothetical protein
MEKLLRQVRRWGVAASVALVGCGGGGDAGPGSIIIDNTDVNTIGTTLGSNPATGGSLTVVGSEPVMPGTYVTPSTSGVSGMLLVHPDGHMLATSHVEPTDPRVLGGWGTTLFAGTVAPSDLGAAGTVTYVFTTPKVPTMTGTATATLIQTSLSGAPALNTSLANATLAIPFDSQTYTQVSVSPALHLLPMSKLAGHYYDASVGQDVQVTPDGAVSGTYAPSCAITATLAAYDPETTLFRMSATLAGTGCAAWLQGTHEYLGNLGASDSGRLMLNAYAISGSTLATLVFTHSQPLGTY